MERKVMHPNPQNPKAKKVEMRDVFNTLRYIVFDVWTVCFAIIYYENYKLIFAKYYSYSIFPVQKEHKIHCDIGKLLKDDLWPNEGRYWAEIFTASW